MIVLVVLIEVFSGWIDQGNELFRHYLFSILQVLEKTPIYTSVHIIILVMDTWH